MPPIHWQSHNLTARLLAPVASIYGGISGLRAWCYRLGLLKTTTLPVPTVVVGNIIAGGAGKTPIVMALVLRLKALGYEPGVIARGYGRKSKDCQEVTSTSTADQVGDEPMLLFHACKAPVIVASSRVIAAQTLLINHPKCNVIVSDDGLQHTALGRDIEIVVFDERALGNGLLLPAGPLRETWPRPRRSRARTHIVLSDVKRSLADYAMNGKGERISLTALKTKKKTKLHAIAGIAKPDNFFQMLKNTGLDLASTQSFPDHADFANYEPPHAAGDLLLCTEKDAVKIWPNNTNVYAVPLHIELDETFLKAFDASIQSHLNLAPTSAPTSAQIQPIPSTPTQPLSPQPHTGATPKHGQQITRTTRMPGDQRPLAL